MAGASAELPQVPQERVGARNRATVSGVRENPEKPVLGDCARGPACGSLIGEPVVRQVVVHVVGIEERHQGVHVEQRDAVHASSLSEFISFIVGRAAPDGREGSSGTPLLTPAGRARGSGPSMDLVRGLPEPVAPWIRWSGAVGKTLISVLRMTRGGRFKASATRSWMPIQGEHVATALKR
jgi:hypothetical protein